MSNDLNLKIRQQIKAGRALLSMDQMQLADALGMKHSKISRADKNYGSSAEKDSSTNRKHRKSALWTDNDKKDGYNYNTI